VRGFPLEKLPPAAAKLRRLAYLTEAIDATGLFTAEWADQGKNLRRESMLAKVFAARAACEAADLALQLRGARGYETAGSQRRRGENPDACERFLRDARGLRLIEGGEDVLLDALAGSGDDAPARAMRAADRFAAECVAAQRARSSAARARR
jgi:alkylation response protein AidB-like acyl-CoA dehydrogenase